MPIPNTAREMTDKIPPCSLKNGTLLKTTARAVTPAPAMTEAILAAAAFLAVLTFALPAIALCAVADIRLRLAAATGDKGRKCRHILRRAIAVLARLLRIRLARLLVLLRTRLMLIARREGLCIARDERLRLRLRHLRLRCEARLVLAGERLTVIVVVEVIVGSALWRSLLGLRVLLIALVRILLAELLLRCGDQAKVMFGVLVVVFRCDRIARALRVARELDIFFRDGRGRAANFDVRSVRFVDPRQRILTFAVLVIVVVVAVVIIVVTSAHALLTVSHDVPFRRPFASLCSGALPPILDSTSPDEFHAWPDLVTPGMGVN